MRLDPAQWALVHDRAEPRHSAFRRGLELCRERCGRRVHPGSLWIDVGAGTGHLAQALAGHGARIVGLDLDPAMALYARRRWSLPFAASAASSLALRDGACAGVVAISLLGWPAGRRRPRGLPRRSRPRAGSRRHSLPQRDEPPEPVAGGQQALGLAGPATVRPLHRLRPGSARHRAAARRLPSGRADLLRSLPGRRPARPVASRDGARRTSRLPRSLGAPVSPRRAPRPIRLGIRRGPERFPVPRRAGTCRIPGAGPARP